jgi:hypothetical protein
VAAQDVAIYRVVANVDLAVREPPVKIFIGGVQNLCKSFVPVNVFSLLGKELGLVLN